MFLVRGSFELFGAVVAGFAIGPGSIKQLLASGFFRGEKMRWDTKFLSLPSSSIARSEKDLATAPPKKPDVFEIAPELDVRDRP